MRWQALARLAREAWGLPRHPSQHPGGMVISTRPLIDICPVQPAAMEGRQLVQWDKDSCADAGFLKIDLLGLGMLSAVERCVEEIARVRGERIDLSRIPIDDPRTFRAIRAADTTGVFQIESRAQMQMLPRTLPETLDDLTVQVALVRPGPIQGGAVHPYLERRERLREDPAFQVPYEHPSLEPILRDTLGTIVFQEQVIQVAMALAGFSAGEAEGLRRAMSRKRSEEAILAYRERFIAGARERGATTEVAERVFEQVRGFSGFGFPKAHAAAFGLLAYQSTWLRVHYGPEFLCSLLNEQPMGFYPPDALVHEAQRGASRCWRRTSTAAAWSARWKRQRARSRAWPSIGLGYITGLRGGGRRALVDERERGGPYARPRRPRLALGRGRRRRSSARLGGGVRADRRTGRALRRRGARTLWRLGVAAAGSGRGRRPRPALPPPPGPGGASLRELDSWERLVADYASTGIALGEHPMALLRPELERRASLERGPRRAPDGRPRGGRRDGRRPPAAGDRATGSSSCCSRTSWGTINVVVPPPVYERAPPGRAGRRRSRVVSGRLERRERVINVVASAVRPTARARPGSAPTSGTSSRPPSARRARRRRDAVARAHAAGQAAELAAVAAGRRTASAGAGDDAAVQDPLQNICSVRRPS